MIISLLLMIITIVRAFTEGISSIDYQWITIVALFYIGDCIRSTRS